MKIANRHANWWKFKTIDELNVDVISEALDTYVKGCSQDKTLGICRVWSEKGFLLAEDALYSDYFSLAETDKTSNYLPIYGISQINSSGNYLNIHYKDGSSRENIYVNIYKDMVETLLTEIMKKETEVRLVLEQDSPQHATYILDYPMLF